MRQKPGLCCSTPTMITTTSQKCPSSEATPVSLTTQVLDATPGATMAVRSSKGTVLLSSSTYQEHIGSEAGSRAQLGGVRFRQ